MNGWICLQGGDEFTPACTTMDRTWLDRVPSGSVTVMPLACAEGAEYRATAHRGQRYLQDLGCDDVSVGPEPDLALAGAVRSILDASTVVIPGGSPSRIRDRVVDTAVGGALRAHIAGGGALVGAGAGAMVLASWMILPGTDDAIHLGLGLLPDLLVLPHYQQERDDVVTTLRERVAADVTILALPACSGVMTTDDRLVSLGRQDCWRYDATGERTAVPRE